MRLLNTAFGEARANEFMTPITQAMYDLARAGVVLNPLKPGLVRVKRVETDPVNGNYLQYHANIELNEDPVGRIMTALRRRTAHLPFGPSVMVIDAKGTKAHDVRARFILNSLGMENRPVEDLAKMDFFVNFMEHVKRSIQEDIFTSMGLSEEQKDNIESLRYVLDKRRTVRDIEDLVWILRNDEDLPARIRDKAGKLESFAVEFSTENYDDMFTLLTTRILDERMKRTGRKKFIAMDGYREGQVA